jgi:hypothetical protein
MKRDRIDHIEKEWITFSQAAAILEYSRQRVYQLVEEQWLRAALVGRDIPGGRGVWILERRSVEDYAEKIGRARPLSVEEANERGL